MEYMSSPRVLSVTKGSPAESAQICEGDQFLSINGRRPRDIIEYQLLVEEPDLEIEIDRGGLARIVTVEKLAGQPLGVEIESALFDQVRTCDNHCEFCFIYQLPKGMRKSLYMKDDDYRLSFLYGNFTTLTRFTEADLERVITERLSPLYVSIHSTDPELRASLLHNKRGATSLRWLKELLKAGIEVHGQIVVCPGINDGFRFEETLLGILEEYPQLKTVAAVPLGISKYSKEPNMRAHTLAEASAVVELVEKYQDIFVSTLGRKMVFASDEYYLLANKQFPASESYDEFSQHENGIGMARAFQDSFNGDESKAFGVKSGFFASVDGAPALGYRAVRAGASGSGSQVQLRKSLPVAIITSQYGYRILYPLVSDHNRQDISFAVVKNEFFGGNIAVAGLMVGTDISRTLSDMGPGYRYLLPDVCLSEGRFLDGISPDALPFPVEIIPTDGLSLSRALNRR
ncbi:MAG: DUF512 domain-containing protein [Actinobacteria bacterium]|jgi:putative radical SAM enzyme (TIGR03279 family)|nr:DUF512 domain-containing protein [Actinomycetota bacterium]